MVDELAVEAEVARDHEDRPVVLEPGQAVHHEPEGDGVRADLVGGAHAEGEGGDASREHGVFDGRRDAVRRQPAGGDLRVRELRGITANGEGDLATGDPSLPGREPDVAVVDRGYGGPAGGDRERRNVLGEDGVEREGGEIRGQRDPDGGPDHEKGRHEQHDEQPLHREAGGAW
ncbi:MAG: hypothetical protein E6H88_10250 [Chloroflexi bacterium]|nr:MAG: hypothetical protein E6H88_10250 [Chloroflexota bacterium]